jgi:hypothetical protein
MGYPCRQAADSTHLDAWAFIWVMMGSGIIFGILRDGRSLYVKATFARHSGFVLSSLFRVFEKCSSKYQIYPSAKYIQYNSLLAGKVLRITYKIGNISEQLGSKQPAQEPTKD